MVIGGSITCADVPGLCESVRVLLEGADADLVVCDVDAVVNADAVLVDALARLQLTARRLGRRIWLRHASLELQELLALVGLADVVPLSAGYCGGTAGRPNSGNSTSVSRKALNPMISPPETSITWRAHGS